MQDYSELWQRLRPFLRSDALLAPILAFLGAPPPPNPFAGTPVFPGTPLFSGAPTFAGGLLASGSAAVDFSGSTGAFKTSTGVVWLGQVSSGRGVAISGALMTIYSATTFAAKISAQPTAFTIPDPGVGGAISVLTDGVCNVSSGGVGETRTIADPTFVGQRITLCCDTHGADIAITGASALDSAGHTHLTFTAAGQATSLVGVTVGSAMKWRLNGNDGGTLS